ncbi:4-hydroxyphenylacetate 3-monooxygenase, oxygenase component [Peribacillus kribbensis]|uniref:4-hydroxyphenylacetate 3-monooxygenase, oxygenase component n=1 Tax=Peribacillus kribbensis TaxID=356658 RepID=UPI0004293B67|nr:4-hydroxyphenylacetate 3-monooxygenase, oxygenase component [Peribacillus kribbensis]
MGAIDGSAYLGRLRERQPEIWINGQRITGNICEHQAFKGILTSKAALYDLQLAPEFRELMTYVSPLSGRRVGTSYLEPRSKEDLEKRRKAAQEWAKASGGLMGRSPDYMNTGIMALGTAWDIFDGNESWGSAIKSLYERGRENDLSFSHTFVTPQVNRSLGYFENNGEEPLAAKVIKTTSDGLIIKGARLLATQGGLTDELVVLPVMGNFIEDSSVYAFSIPSSTKNLKFICRESFSYSSSHYNHPLGSRFEEMDTIVVFDSVEVPWERVFLHKDMEVLFNMYNDSSFYSFLLHQTVARQAVKTEFILGIAQLLVDTIQIDSYQHVKEKVSEIIVGYEIMKSLLLASEMEAAPDSRGRMIPSSNSLYAAISTYPKLHARLMEILQLLGASGLITIPAEEDFDSEVGPDLNHYLKGTDCDAKTKIGLFRLAWDISTSAFGGRQTVYERFFFGDPVRISTGIYNGYERQEAKDLVFRLLND